MITLWDLVCDVQYSRRLQELGFSQSSLFYYVKKINSFGVNGEPLPHQHGIMFIDQYIDYFSGNDYKKENYEILPAYMSGEIGAALPSNIPFIEDGNDDISFLLSGKNPDGEWWINYTKGEKDVKEVNSRAKILIYLLENGLITT